ncbi:MAG: hypothetical protein AABY15_04490 [Nanoarchaeota archaeon]
MEDIKKIFIENASEYYRNALEAEGRKEYNTAVTLYFKAISALCDIYIFAKEGKIPSNHSERFRILEAKYPEIYRIIDRDFPFYQDSYRAKLTRETSIMLKNDAKKLLEILGIRIK